MKIKPQDLEVLRRAIAQRDTEEKRKYYKSAGLSHKRYRWDLARDSGLLRFICDTLYTYLNDDHIDTALRSVVKPYAERAGLASE